MLVQETLKQKLLDRLKSEIEADGLNAKSFGEKVYLTRQRMSYLLKNGARIKRLKELLDYFDIELIEVKYIYSYSDEKKLSNINLRKKLISVFEKSGLTKKMFAGKIGVSDSRLNFIFDFSNPSPKEKTLLNYLGKFNISVGIKIKCKFAKKEVVPF